MGPSSTVLYSSLLLINYVSFQKKKNSSLLANRITYLEKHLELFFSYFDHFFGLADRKEHFRRASNVSSLVSKFSSSLDLSSFDVPG